MKLDMKIVENEEPFKQIVHNGGKILVDNEYIDQSMNTNVKHISTNTKITTRFILKKR